MANLTPYIMSDDARSQANFYVEALGGEIVTVMTHDQMPGAGADATNKVLHMALVVAGVTLFMCDNFRPVQHGDSLHLSLEFKEEDDARRAFDNLTAGGEIRQPLEKAFWGTLFGQVTDKFGVNWMVTTEQQEG
ncbi:VOC family protein [Paenibacillus pasadenensis]|uniref:VOC family protein n=1 Tax=Paenibacillus pasadenensis TaxID=217090 RepID=UPI002041A261|nr:VOC family protein [Paenibacillus pasadenensis]MCM3749916.1 VOC family protein [Paenibacillus pasadenensis]